MEGVVYDVVFVVYNVVLVIVIVVMCACCEDWIHVNLWRCLGVMGRGCRECVVWWCVLILWLWLG